MKKKIIYAILIFFTLFSNNAFSAQSTTKNVIVNILQNKEKISIGESFEVLVEFEVAKDWHIYWDNPGEIGKATQISWILPNGYKAVLKNQTAPKIFYNEGIIQYGYKNKAYYHYEIIADKNILSDKFRDVLFFESDISWTECGIDECVPNKTSFVVDMLINEQDNIPLNGWKENLNRISKNFPKKTNWEGFFNTINNEELVINISTNKKLQNIKKIDFIPHQEDIINNARSASYSYNKDGDISILLPIYEETIEELSGFLLINDKTFEVKVNLDKNITSVNDYGNPNSYGELLIIIIMAFAGGLILNLMPCVLPIITFKAIALAEQSDDLKESKIEAILYFLGVVISFLAIATILIILRINGEKIGWGFQLQSPIFISIMLAVFIFVALMFLDIININLPFTKIGNIAFKQKRINSFITGAFAVVIASPCSAPFMGVAIGYSLTQSIYAYYPIFLALSIGYALPFTLVGFYPATIHKILPKTGAWMITLKKVLSVPIILTCVWLGWVLYNQISTNHNSSYSSSLNWQEFDKELVSNDIKEGKAVFINFTAKWCITCLTNKKTVLDGDKFAKIVKEKDIKTYVADWTGKDAVIAESLEEYERNSVPLYVYYPAGSSKSITLPQILTNGALSKL